MTFRHHPRLLGKFLQFEASLAADLMMFINEKNVCQFMEETTDYSVLNCKDTVTH